MMKKNIGIILAALLCFAAGISAKAQDFSTPRPGVMLGLTSSTAEIKNISTKSVSQYHVGLVYEIPLGAGFAIQPGLLYQVKGMSLDDAGNSTVGDILKSFDTKVGYIEVPVQLQWGPDLVAFRPYVLAEPFVGYQITAKGGNEASKTLNDSLKKVEYGLGVGAGIDIWKFQVSAKWFWNFGGIYKSDTAATIDTIKDIQNGNNFHGLAVSLAFLF